MTSQSCQLHGLCSQRPPLRLLDSACCLAPGCSARPCRPSHTTTTPCFGVTTFLGRRRPWEPYGECPERWTAQLHAPLPMPPPRPPRLSARPPFPPCLHVLLRSPPSTLQDRCAWEEAEQGSNPASERHGSLVRLPALWPPFDLLPAAVPRSFHPHPWPPLLPPRLSLAHPPPPPPPPPPAPPPPPVMDPEVPQALRLQVGAGLPRPGCLHALTQQATPYCWRPLPCPGLLLHLTASLPCPRPFP